MNIKDKGWSDELLETALNEYFFSDEKCKIYVCTKQHTHVKARFKPLCVGVMNGCHASQTIFHQIIV